MPEESKFFRFVWRLDAILLALAGILVIGLAGTLIATEFLATRYRPTPTGHFAPVPKGAEKDSTYRLEFEPVGLSTPNVDLFSLKRWNGSPRSYGLAMEMVAKPSFVGLTDSVNLLVVDTANGKSQWLFNGYKRRVLSIENIYGVGRPVSPTPDAVGATPTPIAFIIRTLDADTNGDGELNDKDMQSFYVYKLGDRHPRKFFQSEFILSMHQSEDGSYVIVFEKGASAFVAKFHVPEFKLISQQKLPDVPL